jgi:hypothetical protein
VMRSLDPETKEAIQDAGKGNKEEAMRKRASGDDDLSKRYLRRAQEASPDLMPPTDQAITSLWVGGVDATVNIYIHTCSNSRISLSDDTFAWFFLFINFNDCLSRLLFSQIRMRIFCSSF